MKILICMGSYRKNGNTDQFVGLIQAELLRMAEQQKVPLELETVYLGNQNINPCRGCRVCFNKGEEKCPLKDDLLEIKRKMQAADGLLIASPVYVDDVNGITKNWIDRLAHVCHRPEFAGKCAYAVVTVGSSPTQHALQTLTLALNTWGYHLVGKTGVKAGAWMKPDEMQAHHQAAAQTAARRFFRAIQTRAYTRPAFLNLMMFKIQQQSWQKSDPTTLDYQYWKSQGWFEPGRDFYIPHAASRVKVALARLTGSLISRFVAS